MKFKVERQNVEERLKVSKMMIERLQDRMRKSVETFGENNEKGKNKRLKSGETLRRLS